MKVEMVGGPADGLQIENVEDGLEWIELQNPAPGSVEETYLKHKGCQPTIATYARVEGYSRDKFYYTQQEGK